MLQNSVHLICSVRAVEWHPVEHVGFGVVLVPEFVLVEPPLMVVRHRDQHAADEPVASVVLSHRHGRVHLPLVLPPAPDDSVVGSRDAFVITLLAVVVCLPVFSLVVADSKVF